ncbi:hypothetical protein CK203_006462 [Vitis vinifera]|uniref:Uncharacterized protein n=1 Tax=Vitis vinifera TaxID=29760 RepID=A0A438KBE5_VITVI|nr:hypothetical protein CK203_006462 [Vitis vinifera]
MDAVLQIFKRSICPGTPFFESLAKKPPTTMDDLFRRANKYSMLEDDVRAATQQVLVAGRASRETRTDMPNLRTGQNQLTGAGRAESWPRPLETDPSIRDRSKKCAFHKDHDTGGRDVSQHHNSGAPRAPVAPKAVINYINGGPSDEEYDSRRKRQKLLRAASIRERINSIRPGLTGEGPRPIDGTIIFPPAVQPIWCKHQSLAIWDIVSRVSKTPDESYPDSTDHQHILRRHYTAGQLASHSQRAILSGTRVSPFNVILGRTWLHYMKAIPSTYHQMVSFLTNEGQTDLYGSQLAARQCYQIAREAVANQEDASPPEPSIAHDQ